MVGIIDVEVAFPAGRRTVQQMHELSGRPVADILAWTHCPEIPVFDEHEQAWELQADIARKVLDRAGVDASEIGQVIVGGGGDWDVPSWSPAAKIAAELGVTDAHCFEVLNFCSSSSASLQVAGDAITLGRTKYSLLLFGERVGRSIDCTDPESVSLFNVGDAAAAVLLGPGPGRFELLRTQTRSEPTWSDFLSGEIDGERMVIRLRGRQRGISKMYLERYQSLIREALTALELTPDDVDHFVINQVDRRMHERLLDTLGIPFDRSVFNYHRLGHMSSTDPFIGLCDLRDAGRLADGDLILLATSGFGFSWGVTALRYRDR